MQPPSAIRPLWEVLLGQPLRRCIVLDVAFPRSFLVRFVRALSPHDDSVHVVPDLLPTRPRPGRGAYTFARRDVMDRALSTGVFRRLSVRPGESPPPVVPHARAIARKANRTVKEL